MFENIKLDITILILCVALLFVAIQDFFINEKYNKVHKDLCQISTQDDKSYKMCMNADLDTVIKVLDMKLNLDEVR